MSRMQEIGRRLSGLKLNRKHLIYLISEDRDILEVIFSRNAATMKALAGKGLQENCKASNEKLYRFVRQNNYLVDVYTVKEFEGKFSETFFAETSNTAKGIVYQANFLFFNDFHILKKETASHFLKQFLDYAKEQEKNNHPVYLFLISNILMLPAGFESVTEIIDVPEMDEEDIIELLSAEAVKEQNNNKALWEVYEEDLCKADRERIEEAAKDFKGMSRRDIMEIVEALRSSNGSFFGMSNTPCGRPENIKEIQEKRRSLVKSYKEESARYDSTVTLLDPQKSVSGLDGYKNWLKEIKDDMLHPDECQLWGMRPPKGVLLSGVPGSGKTQAAKLTAYQMNVPLVQFRMDNLLGGLVGDSEANFKRCRKRIEALAPCVVLIDELEKLFGTEDMGGSHEVKMNLLAALLDWLQENNKAIFFFATSNSVKGLRPELLRDGRFDMRFYVFMPAKEELIEIFKFHLKKADQLSGNILCNDFRDQYDKLASDFFDSIADYGKKEKRNLFYTGANIESLILQTHRALRRSCRNASEVSFEDYRNMLFRTAIGGDSQPYGETNMKDIALSWLEARQNQYMQAGKGDLFSFRNFDEGVYDEKEALRRKPQFLKRPETNNEYDRQMFERIQEEICNLQEKINCRDRF